MGRLSEELKQRSKNDRLCKMIVGSEIRAAIQEVETERDTLQARVQVLEGALDYGWKKSMEEFSANNSKLRASNTRLREALEGMVQNARRENMPMTSSEIAAREILQ